MAYLVPGSTREHILLVVVYTWYQVESKAQQENKNIVLKARCVVRIAYLVLGSTWKHIMLVVVVVVVVVVVFTLLRTW